MTDPSTTEGPAASAELVAETDDGQLVVPPDAGTEHGYIGHRPRTEPNDSFTVTGVTGGTANVADTPSSQ